VKGVRLQPNDQVPPKARSATSCYDERTHSEGQAVWHSEGRTRSGPPWRRQNTNGSDPVITLRRVLIYGDVLTLGKGLGIVRHQHGMNDRTPQSHRRRTDLSKHQGSGINLPTASSYPLASTRQVQATISMSPQTLCYFST